MNRSADDLVLELEELVQTFDQQADPDLSLNLFRVLGWDKDDYRLETGRANDTLQEYHLAVAGETTAYLFLTRHELSDQLVRTAANVAYNSGIDWIAVTNFATTKLAHARWWEDPTYLSINSDQYTQRLDDLELISPDGIISGELSRRGQAVARDKVLLPIDQHLMERLETWRRLLLRNSTDVTDEQIHELIGRLFFVRSCEDRGIIAPESLLSVCSEQASSQRLSQRLNELFASFSRDFDSELFLNPQGQEPLFDDVVVSQIIQELYIPFRGVPHYRYDFSYLNVDVLGKVYEKYVATVLERLPAEEANQLPLLDFQGPREEVQTRSRRREQGIYYTPPFIVNYIVQHTVERLLKETPDARLRVADISCGSGAFLIRAAERLAAWAREIDTTGTESNWARQVISQVVGVDADARAVTLARVNLWILTTMGEPPRPLPELGASVIAADALNAPELDSLRGQLDVVVGNPPFRPAAEIDRVTQERLRRRYRSASGRFDLAYVFLERALELVRPGGFVGLVLPNRLFTNADARFLRDLVTEAATVEQIVDFGQERPFAEGISYTTIVILRKNAEISIPRALTPSGDSKAMVQVHQILQMAEYPGLQLRRADLLDGQEFRDQYSHIFLAQQPATSGPWIWWASDIDDRIRQKLAAESRPLHQVAELPQGVKTGDNRVFLMKRVASDTQAGHWIVINGLGDRAEVEPDLLRPYVSGSSIARYSIVGESEAEHVDYILYPHQAGRLLDLFELQAMFPATFAYLMRYRDRLSSRSTVARGGAWYDLSWPRADGWLERPKVLTRELVPMASFAADNSGQYVPVGGTAILPRNKARIPLHLLLAVLNSSITTWYLTYRAARFQSGYIKVVPGELKSFQFPWDLLLAENELTRRIATLAESASTMSARGLSTRDIEEEIDGTIFDILGFDDNERDAVRSRVETLALDVKDANQRFQGIDEPPTFDERVALVDRLLAGISSSGTRRERETASLLARQELLAAIGSSGLAKSKTSKSLITFVLLGVDHIARTRASEEQIALLRDVLRASREDASSDESVAAYERQLREAGLDVLLGTPGASILMAGDDQETDDELDPADQGGG